MTRELVCSWLVADTSHRVGNVWMLRISCRLLSKLTNIFNKLAPQFSSAQVQSRILDPPDMLSEPLYLMALTVPLIHRNLPAPALDRGPVFGEHLRITHRIVEC